MCADPAWEGATVVTKVSPKSQAAKAKLPVYSAILRINSEPVRTNMTVMEIASRLREATRPLELVVRPMLRDAEAARVKERQAELARIDGFAQDRDREVEGHDKGSML